MRMGIFATLALVVGFGAPTQAGQLWSGQGITQFGNYWAGSNGQSQGYGIGQNTWGNSGVLSNSGGSYKANSYGQQRLNVHSGSSAFNMSGASGPNYSASGAMAQSSVYGGGNMGIHVHH